MVPPTRAEGRPEPASVEDRPELASVEERPKLVNDEGRNRPTAESRSMQMFTKRERLSGRGAAGSGLVDPPPANSPDRTRAGASSHSHIMNSYPAGP